MITAEVLERVNPTLLSERSLLRMDGQNETAYVPLAVIAVAGLALSRPRRIP